MENRILKSQDIISVIISAYNAEGTIRNTLDSLENQDIDKNLYEVIIVDDGSRTDTMRKIVEEYVQRKIMKIYYYYQENRWVGIARNNGITKSVGKIIAFTDADCIPDKDWISVIYQKLLIEKKQFIGWYTYSNDTVIFPWKMAPVWQTGITANLAVDFTLIDWVLFDSGFTGMLGDDTDFVLRMESSGYPMVIVSEMRVLHPPNIIGLDRIIIRARWQHNLVWLYQKHREKVLSSFSYIFRPVVFSRISPFSIFTLISILIIYSVYKLFWYLGCITLFWIFTLVFHIYLYRFLVTYNPDGRIIPMRDRWRTFISFLLIIPLFFYYRIVWMIKFRFFML